jgi:hypothetical protein
VQDTGIIVLAMCVLSQGRQSVTSQKFQKKENEFPYFQILEPTKTFLELSLIHSDLA